MLGIGHVFMLFQMMNEMSGLKAMYEVVVRDQ